MQETWESAVRRPPAADRPTEPWLRRAIKNRMLNRAREERRRDAREQKSVSDATSDSPEELLARLQIHKKLVEAVARLAEPYRQTVLLRYFEELSSTDIATRLQIPAATVRGRLKTAVELLREDLDRTQGGRKVWMGMVLVLAGGRLGTQSLVAGAGVAAQGSLKMLGLAIGVLSIGVVTTKVLVRPATAPAAARVVQGPQPSPVRFERGVGRPEESPPPPAPQQPAVATVAPPPVAGAPAAPASPPLFSITGRVHFAGSLPPRAPIDMSSDPFCGSQPKAEDDSALVDRDGFVANAVVRITSRSVPAGRPPAQPLVIEQKGCRYQPRVAVAQVGQVIEFRNVDQALHSVHGYPGGRSGFTGALAAGTPPFTATATRAGEVIRVKCDVHPWMTATILTAENAFFALTDRDGRYTLGGLPAGAYTLQAWHETVPYRYADVTVGPGRVAEDVDFFLGAQPRGEPGACQLPQTHSWMVRACRDGGIKGAKAAMKTLQKLAKARGVKFECDDCHKDGAAGNWALLKDAQERFEKLLRAAREDRDPRFPP